VSINFWCTPDQSVVRSRYSRAIVGSFEDTNNTSVGESRGFTGQSRHWISATTRQLVWSLPHLFQRQIFGTRWLAAIGLLVAWSLLWSSAWCKAPQRDDVLGGESEKNESRQLPTSSRVNRTLKALRADLRSKRYSNALANFRRLTTADSTALVALPGNRKFVPLHQILAKEFEDLPADLQATLRRTDASAAQLALNDAMHSSDWSDVIQVMHRFPGTESGHLARLLLAQLHLNRGETLAARYCLQSLEALSTSVAITQAGSEMRSRLEQKEADAPQPASGVTAQKTWQVKWQQRPKLSSALRDELETLQSQARTITDVAWNVDVHDGVIYRRSLRGLTALDQQTGETKWSLRLKPSHLDQLKKDTPRSLVSGLRGAAPPEQNRQLLFHDGVLNGMSAGADAIYVVTAAIAPEGFIAAQMGRMTTQPNAHLVAVSKSSGQRLWSVGGPELEADANNELADVWFAGPPLVDGDLLYCVVQRGNEMRLVTLRTRTGEVEDSTLLAFPEESIERDSSRRLVAASPALAGGLILCPTTTNWLVAIDCLTRTVVWASHTGSRTPNRDRALRMNGPQARNPFSSEQSPRSNIHLFGRSAIVLPWNSAEIHAIDVITGTEQKRMRSFGRPCALAAVDDGVIIFSKRGRTLERLDVLNGKRLWKRQLTPEDGVPCGAGVVEGGKLQLAMTTGAIAAVDIGTGEFRESTPGVLRASQHGRLVSISKGVKQAGKARSGDLLFIGPVDTVCLTPQPTDITPEQSTAAVELLVATRQVQEAWTALSRLPAEELSDNVHVAALKFDVAFALAVDGKPPLDVSLSELAVTEEQRLRANVVRTVEQFDWDPVAVMDLVVEIVQQHDSYSSNHRDLPVLLPVSLLPGQMSSATERDSATQTSVSQVSLQVWASQVIEHVLNKTPPVDRTAIENRLIELPPAILLLIHHSAVAPAIRSHLDEATLREQTVHLLLHLNAIQSDDTVPVIDDLTGWQNSADSLTARSSNEALRQSYLQMLLSVVDNPNVDGAMHGLMSSEQFTDNTKHDNQLREWWDSWDRDDYLAIPFARPDPSQGRPYRLKLVKPGDLFLRNLELVIHRVPSRLLIREIAPSGQLIWSIPGSFPGQPGTADVPEISRAGSLLLIASSVGVAAVSLIEQRVMWQRQVGVRNDAYSDESGSRSVRRVTPRLIASSTRWVCIHTGQFVELLDALTGQVLWSHSVSLPNTVFASESCVVVHDHTSNSVTALERRTGQEVDHQFSSDNVRQIVSTSGTNFVVQQQDADEPRRIRLTWQNAVTGNVSKTVEVSDAAHVQQDDSSQIAVFSKDGRLSVVDLKTAAIRSYRWAKESGADEDLPSNEDWAAERIRFFEDRAFIYLTHHSEEAQTSGRIPERQLTSLRHLRTLDRLTGERLWETAIPESRRGIMVTDQLSLPFVAILDHAAPDSNGSRDPRIRLRCLRKRDGRLLIESQLPSLYSYDEMRLSANDDYSVSAEIHGTHVRFERPNAPSVHPPNAD
jgi:outer membrane protein assembly factor BamB